MPKDAAAPRRGPAAAKPAAAAAPAAAPAPAAPKPAPAAAPAPQPAAASGGGRIFASPLAKRMAADKGLDLSRIKGSGPHGRIVKADVERRQAGRTRCRASGRSGAARGAAGRRAAVFAAPGDTRVPHTSMRKVIARRCSSPSRRCRTST